VGKEDAGYLSALPERIAQAVITAGARLETVELAYADSLRVRIRDDGKGIDPAVIAEGSASVLLLLVAAKGLAYALSLGSGFRGGPVFPALAIGVALAMAAADVLPGLDTTPAVAIGLAAGTAAVLRAPFTGVLLATLLLGSSAYDVTPIAVFAAATAWLVAVALPNPEDRLREAADAPVGDEHAADPDRDE
jgi:H+/Cl- antiporter ClcA